MKRRLLLTGGSGFIGRNLRENPAFQGYEVLAPAHAELELTDEDAVRKFLKNERIEFVVHSAVKPGHRNAKDASLLLHNNLRMFFNLERNRHLVERMVVIGSGAIYDNRHYGTKRKEQSYEDHVPIDDHGLAKYVIEKALEGSQNIFDLRVFGIYGKYEDYQIRFISNMVCKALLGVPLTVKQDRNFDYLFVDDLAPVVAGVLDSGLPWRSINVTPDESTSLVAIAHMVLEVAGRMDLPVIVAQPGLGLEYSGDNSRLRQWKPDLELTPLRTGIERLVAWYRQNWHTVDKTRLEVDP